MLSIPSIERWCWPSSGIIVHPCCHGFTHRFNLRRCCVGNARSGRRRVCNRATHWALSCSRTGCSQCCAKSQDRRACIRGIRMMGHWWGARSIGIGTVGVASRAAPYRFDPELQKKHFVGAACGPYESQLFADGVSVGSGDFVATFGWNDDARNAYRRPYVYTSNRCTSV